MSQYPPKGSANYFAPGDWNANCFQCASKFKASELKKHWQGYYVCERCWEPRHPQDFVRGVLDKPAAPWIQQVGETYATYCTPTTQSAVPGASIPGCMVPGYLSPAFNTEELP